MKYLKIPFSEKKKGEVGCVHFNIASSLYYRNSEASSLLLTTSDDRERMEEFITDEDETSKPVLTPEMTLLEVAEVLVSKDIAKDTIEVVEHKLTVEEVLTAIEYIRNQEPYLPTDEVADNDDNPLAFDAEGTKIQETVGIEEGA